MISLCPLGSYPIPRMMIGVTEMMVMMTMDAKISKVMVERERQLISRLDFMLRAQLFLNWVSI
jgi:hypothetical protein